MGNSVKLPKSFVAVNLSEKLPDAFGERRSNGRKEREGEGEDEDEGEAEKEKEGDDVEVQRLEVPLE